MESADLREVFRRLAETKKPLLDERMKEFPLPSGFHDALSTRPRNGQ